MLAAPHRPALQAWAAAFFRSVAGERRTAPTPQRHHNGTTDRRSAKPSQNLPVMAAEGDPENASVWLGDDSLPDGPHRRLRAVVDGEFAEQVLHMLLDGLNADRQRF